MDGTLPRDHEMTVAVPRLWYVVLAVWLFLVVVFVANVIHYAGALT